MREGPHGEHSFGEYFSAAPSASVVFPLYEKSALFKFFMRELTEFVVAELIIFALYSSVTIAMNNVVIILGAGASAPFGVPTLLRVFQDQYARQHLQDDRSLSDQLQRLFWTPRGHTLETSHHGLSVEEILTVVKDFENQVYGVAPILNPEDRASFRRSLYVLIKKAVYNGKTSRGKYLNTLIQFMRGEARNVTWASFNWDCIFEASYYYSSGNTAEERSNPRVIVNLQNWHQPRVSNHTFLKLHGGVNWWYQNNAIVYVPFGAQPDLEERWARYERGEVGGNPVLLEPSYYKYEDPMYDHLRIQWNEFVQKLLGADLVIVIGYSLAEADLQARTALTVGFQSNGRSKVLVVDLAESICSRYERLFGSVRLRTVPRSLQDIHEQLPDIIQDYMRE